jgi:hypothetical protein
MPKHRSKFHGTRHLLMPHPIGHTLRALARWAVAASLSVSGACETADRATPLRQSVPEAADAAPQQPQPSAADSAPDGDSDEPDAQAAIDAGRPTRSPADAGGPSDSGSLMDAAQPPLSDVWNPIACDDFMPKVFANPLRLARDVDSFGLYRMRSYRYEGPFPADPDVVLQDLLGKPCSTSSDAAACSARVDAMLAPSDACKTSGRCIPFAVTTHGDEVRLIDDRAELMQLLGSIDGQEEAVIAAFFEDLALACWSDERGTRIAHGKNWRVQTRDLCPQMQEARTLEFDAAGNLVSDEREPLKRAPCATGRRPPGLQLADAPHTTSSLGRFFAELTQLEAASVPAFERIERELVAFDAPSELIAAAHAAAADERRHARVMTELARDFGAEPGAPTIEDRPLRSRFDFALDNAVEGCVRETFGALLAHHQSACATDPRIARVLTGIAEDETRHAELSWAIAAWLEPQLTAADCERLQRVRDEAFAELSHQLEPRGLSSAELQTIGWPAAPIASELLARMALAVAS